MRAINQLRKIFLCSFLLGFLIPNIYSQPKDKSKMPFQLPVFLEKNILFSDTSVICYLSYRVPYNNLIFVKNGEKYSSGFVLDIEISSSNKIIDRKSTTKSVSVFSYDSTSSENDFLEGFIRIPLTKEDYQIKPFVSFLNSESNILLDSLSLHKEDFIKSNIGHPIVIKHSKFNCNRNKEFQIVNYLNSIPYSLESYDLLIPVLDSTITEVNITISQDMKEKLKKTVKEYLPNVFYEDECVDKIILRAGLEQKKVKYFLLKEFNHLLNENDAFISVSYKNEKPVKFQLPVIWQNKPFSLMNPKLAIELLQAIESEKKIDTLLDSDKDDYPIVLNKYWNDKNPDKNNSFNRIMCEYYKRADYAIKNFSSVTNQIGAKSDRGIMYIRYGKPDEIRRTYSDGNSVTEIWEYKSLKKTFSFTDKTGLGNYIRDYK